MSDLFGSALPHAAIPADQTLAALRLIRSEQVGARTFHMLTRRFGDPQRAVAALPALARRPGKRGLVACPPEKAAAELEQAQHFGARPILYGTPEYPALLAQLADAPPVLFALGDVALLHKDRMLAIVGARNASAQGYAFARQLARDAAEAGYGVVSGLARGIDAAAHGGALDGQGVTVGVIAGGIDTRYPQENAVLYDRMAREGVILTEQPFGMAPQSRAFPARNRIIAGLSQATLVVEAALRSGSLITAECAAEAGREVFAVPGSPLDPRAHGTNHLLKQGAHLTERFADIHQHWPRAAFARPHSNLEHRDPALPASLGFAEPQAEPLEETMPDTAPETARERADDLIARVRGKLGASMVVVDELALQCNVAPGALQAILVELELDGTLLRGPGNRVGLRPGDA